MIVLFDSSFSKSLNKLNNRQVKAKIKSSIERIENARHLTELTGLKAIKGYPGF